MPSQPELTSQPLPKLSPRRADSHKGTYGRVLLVGGSRGMAGAIALAGLATARSGAGLVTVATPRVVQRVVAGFSPVLMTLGLADDGEGFAPEALEPLMEFAQRADVVAIGPGLGRSEGATQIVLRLYRELPQPMVVDADALYALSASLESLTAPGGPRVLTPHPGEFARLSGTQPVTPAERIAGATWLAWRDTTGQTVVLLKGDQTVVANGHQYSLNTTGNPGMATGGTGDVLTGIVAALVAQGLSAWQGARLGAHLHGLAGDLAAGDKGQISLIASDLIDYLPLAFESYLGRAAAPPR